VSRRGPSLRARLSTLIPLVMAAAFALPASAAHADLINLATCESSVVRQPFARWGDLASYELSPGGDFEQPKWALNGGAQRSPGSEPYAATGKVGNWSLALPAGASAESPLTCVNATHPTVRFFIAGPGSVAVSLVYRNTEIPVGTVVAGSIWVPTPVMVTAAPLCAATSGGTAQLSLRLRGLSGDPEVDDVFVDPWNRG
jgi:hypothetical protein